MASLSLDTRCSLGGMVGRERGLCPGSLPAFRSQKMRRAHPRKFKENKKAVFWEAMKYFKE